MTYVDPPASWSVQRTSRACPVCGANDGSPLYLNRLSAIGGFDLGYVVQECRRCRAGYADSIASEADFGNYYSTCSKYDVVNASSSVAEASKVRAQIATGLLMRHGHAIGAALDIGCGIGTLLDALRSAGANRVVGLDPAKNAPESARALYGVTSVEVGSLADALRRPDLATFHTICLTGVLEHLVDPAAALTSLCGAMREDALLLVEVPAVETFLDRPLEPFGEFSLEHINFFCVDALQLIAGRSRLNVAVTSIEPIGPGVTGSLFALLAPAGKMTAGPRRCRSLRSYTLACLPEFETVVARAASLAERQPIALYGAGSHTARLVPALLDRLPPDRIVKILDSNPNLVGSSLGPWTVGSPDELLTCPEVPVVVSSFRAADSIVQTLRARYSNRIITLYDHRI